MHIRDKDGVYNADLTETALWDEIDVVGIAAVVQLPAPAVSLLAPAELRKLGERLVQRELVEAVEILPPGELVDCCRVQLGSARGTSDFEVAFRVDLTLNVILHAV